MSYRKHNFDNVNVIKLPDSYSIGVLNNSIDLKTRPLVDRDQLTFSSTITGWFQFNYNSSSSGNGGGVLFEWLSKNETVLKLESTNNTGIEKIKFICLK